MKRQTLAIISIIAIGSLFGTVSATTILDTTSIFQNITVLGSCTGCGGETSFTSYNTIALNTTASGTADNGGICTLKIGNDGAVLLGGSVNTKLVYINGTTVYDVPAFGSCNNYFAQIDQSVNGEYKLTQDSTTSQISVFKNNSLLQKLGLNTSQCHVAVGIAIAISPNGKYITATCEDSGTLNDRVVIFQGS